MISKLVSNAVVDITVAYYVHPDDHNIALCSSLHIVITRIYNIAALCASSRVGLAPLVFSLVKPD